jgi:hypothetical protein
LLAQRISHAMGPEHSGEMVITAIQIGIGPAVAGAGRL